MNNELKITGQVALPTILLLGGIVIEITVAGALLAFIFNNSGFAARLSAEALAAAQAGVQDALLRMTIDKNFSSLGYNIAVGQRSTAAVIVNINQPQPGKSTVISTGTSSVRKRKVKAIVSINAYTGQIQLNSLTEVILQ